MEALWRIWTNQKRMMGDDQGSLAAYHHFGWTLATTGCEDLEFCDCDVKNLQRLRKSS